MVRLGAQGKLFPSQSGFQLLSLGPGSGAGAGRLCGGAGAAESPGATAPSTPLSLRLDGFRWQKQGALCCEWGHGVTSYIMLRNWQEVKPILSHRRSSKPQLPPHAATCFPPLHSVTRFPHLNTYRMGRPYFNWQCCS